MKIHKEELGKVSITIEGKFNPAKIYDRLCLVGDGQFGIYISKKELQVELLYLMKLIGNVYLILVKM